MKCLQYICSVYKEVEEVDEHRREEEEDLVVSYPMKIIGAGQDNSFWLLFEY
jgi:hypothetical protein